MKTIVKIFNFVVIALVVINSAFAQTTTVPACNLTEVGYERFSWRDPNINTLVSSVTTGIAFSMFDYAVGDDPDGICECTNAVKAGAASTACNALFNAKGPDGRALRQHGSLAGIVNVLEATMEEPFPLDAAYAWNRAIEPIPFARTALAQAPEYTGPYLDFVYDIWVVIRDIAFAVMAIVMLVVGIMLITQKRVGPQSSVTLQLALPRLAIALVLISFSYTIGAIGASLAYNLGFSVDAFVEKIQFTSASAGSLAITGLISGLILFIGYIWAVVAIGPLLLLVLVAVIVVVVYMWVMAWFEFMKTYLKILVAIVAAPITFSLGAIPGNEAATQNWFKAFGAAIITLPAINLMVKLTTKLSIHLVGQLGQAGASSVTGGALLGSFLGIFITPLILIFGFSYARKIPEKINTLVVGPPPKGPKK
jgi:hypothetical protein